MRGRKPYNIRNVEAHLTSLQNSFRPIQPNTNLIFQNTVTNNIQLSEQQKQNEFINAKFGVSKYASNLVSGKMFKKI
jgi:hypothetical protein